MSEEEAKRLLQNQVPWDITGKDCFSSIVRLCDGLPPTIIKAGTMLCDGDYIREEIADLLKDFDDKKVLHGDDLFPKDDRYDDGDGSDDQGPSANHLILASHHSKDRSSRLLEDLDAHDDADNQSTAANPMTVPGHCTQDPSNHLLEKVNNDQSSEGGNVMNEQTACRIKRSDILAENTTLTCKSPTGKDMTMNMMSVEKKGFQPSQVSVQFPKNIPEKKTKRAGCLEDNSQQDYGPVLSNFNKGKCCQEMSSRFPVDADKAKSHDHNKYDTGNSHSERSARTNDTEDDRASETLVKRPYNNINTSKSGNITTLSHDQLSGTCTSRITEYLPSQEYEAMSNFGSRDEWPKSQPLSEKDVQCPSQQEKLHVRSDNTHDESDPEGTTTMKPTVLSGYGKQGNGKTQQTRHLSVTGAQAMSPVGRDLVVAPTTETRTVLSVQNQISSTPNGSSNHSQLTDHVEAAVEQKGTGIFASVFRVLRETFHIFKELES